jgi:hypothetical protein
MTLELFKILIFYEEINFLFILCLSYIYYNIDLKDFILYYVDS